MSDNDKKTADIKQDNGKLSAAEKQARLAEALRANLRRHRARNGNQKLYWPGAEMLAVEEGAATIAKPVDDVYRGDGDTDRAIGLGVSRMKRK